MIRRAPITPAYRDQAPAGPPLPEDNVDRIITLLERETQSSSLRSRLIDLGWLDSSGTPVDWKFWWLRREQRWI